MYLSSSSVAVGFGLIIVAADGVLGGSRLWEAQAPNPRTNPDPFYAALKLNSTSALAKRAMSLQPEPYNAAQPRIWPNKKIRYCFEDETPIIKYLWHLATKTWSELEGHGFSYEKVSDRVCQRDRANVLRVHYNSDGRLMTDPGIPPRRSDIDGPEMHLSDVEGIGQNDIQANVAHELGHAWGLYHDHQNRQWWQKSDEHWDDPHWGGVTFSPKKVFFQTDGFDCTALKGYEEALEAAQQAARENKDNELDPFLICISRQTAEDYGFAASEWLPWAEINVFDRDPTFDKQSIMLYPSQAGGKGVGNQRRVVMTYADGSAIPNRYTPSTMDIQRLVTLYGTTSRSPGEVHLTSGMKGTFNRLWKSLSGKNLRAGSTRQGLC